MFPLPGNENIGSSQILFVPLSRAEVQALNSTVLPPHLAELKAELSLRCPSWLLGAALVVLSEEVPGENWGGRTQEPL